MVEQLLLFPEIETERLLLRKVELTDANDMFSVTKDDEVARFLAWSAHQSIIETNEFIKSFIHGYKTGECFRWAIALKSSNRFIGLINLKPAFSQNRVSLGYWLGRSFWNKGYATEAVKAVICLLFDKLNVNRIEAEHFIENPASGRVMEKAGMEYEGLLRQYILGKEGKYHDCKIYAITQDKYTIMSRINTTTPKLVIARAAIDDADAVGRVTALSWQAAYSGIVPDEYLAHITPESCAAKFREVLPQLPDAEFFLVFVENKPTGVFNLHTCRDGDTVDCGEIGVFYFLSEHWGRGYGAEAMVYALNRLKERGFASAILWVLEENARARRFYEKQGFMTDGGRKVITLGKELVDMRYRKSLL